MQEKEFDKDDVKRTLFNGIQECGFNNLVTDPHFKEVVDYSFDICGKDIYTRSEMDGDIKSFLVKLLNQTVIGYLAPWEREVVKCRKKFSFKWKGEAQMGGAEWWVHFILGWPFHEAAGCDLKDPKGKGVDIKLITDPKSNIKTPGQFFDKNGIGFFKHHDKTFIRKDVHHKWITHGFYKRIWDNKDLPYMKYLYSGMFDFVESFKINFPQLDRYMCFALNNNILDYTEKTKYQIENDANHNIIQKTVDWHQRADVTHSDWEHGAIIYTNNQFKGVI